ncbi:MAG: alpha/beta hydrolase [Clostridiales bacterium]|nr:alpha/beta hydrolase [Clostridiales bacterium]
MNNKKLTITLSIIGLTSAALTGLFTINKVINKLATAKGLLDNKNREIYHWRFGDISYKTAGEGKPVLLIHNLKEDSSSVEWSEIVSRLSRTNTVYSIDLLGCGLSDRPGITYTSYMYTQLINDFIRNVIKRKTSVIATGKSSAFLLGACDVNEDAFEELILINPESIHNLNKAPSKRTKTAELILKTPIIGTFIYHLITTRKTVEQNFTEKYFYDPENISEALIECYYESAHLADGSAKNLCTSLVGRYSNANIVRTLKNINKNIHIIAGHELPGIEADMKEYQYYNPAVEVEYIEFTKLLPQLEAPDELMKLIDLYLCSN